MTPLQHLIRRVGHRCLAVAIAAQLHRGLLIAAAAALLTVLAARLLGLIPPRVLVPVLWTLAVIPLALIAVAARRPRPDKLARLIDARAGGKDLFLTALQVGEASADFQPIVVARAEERATEIDPAQVVPFHWQSGVRDVLIAVALLAAALAGLPQLDPLKKQAARNRLSERAQQLVETRKATEIRREELAQKKDGESAQIQQALTRLEQTFKQAKPAERETTLKQLAEEQKELGELWRKANNSELRKALDEAAQNFGQVDPKKLEAWRNELKQGDATALKKELGEIREEARKLAGMPDSAEKRALQEELARRLNETAQAMKQMANAPQLNAALQRALEQMDLSKLSELSQEAMQAAADSLQLSEEELNQLAQALKDGRQLEEALKNLQMARKLAGEGKLDGSEAGDAQGMNAYAALFAEKMGEGGASPGLSKESGLGPGQGTGATRPEDETTSSAFKTEKSNSQLSGGKMLLEWKSKEVGETGARNEDYRSALQQVQQGVAEAIQQEQVPPGYHDTIKRYFDSLPEKK